MMKSLKACFRTYFFVFKNQNHTDFAKNLQNLEKNRQNT